MLPIISIIVIGASYALTYIIGNTIENKINENIVTGSEIAKNKIFDIISYYSKNFINRWILNLSIIFISYMFGSLFNQINLYISISIIYITISMIYTLIKTFNLYIDSAQKYNTLDPVYIFYKTINDEIYRCVVKETYKLSSLKKIITMLFAKKNTIDIAKEITNNAIKNIRIALSIRLILLIVGFLIYLLIYEKLFIFTTGITFNSFWEPVIWPYTFLCNQYPSSLIFFTVFLLIVVFIIVVTEFRRITAFFKLWIRDNSVHNLCYQQAPSITFQESANTSPQDGESKSLPTEKPAVRNLILTEEQMAWLKSKLHFETLADILNAAKDKFPNSDIVPTILMAGRTGAGKSSLINALAGRHISPVGVIPTTQQPTPHELGGGGVPLRVIDMPGVGEAGRHGERMDTVLAQADAAHLLLLTVPCPERNLDFELKLLSEVQQHFEGRTPLPVLAAGTKVDSAAPARDWEPGSLNLAAPSTEKERNIVDWLAYAASVLPGVKELVPCSSGESFDDVAGQYGISAMRRRIFGLLPDSARSYFARVTRDKELLDSRAENIIRLFSGMASAAATQPLPSVPDSALIMPVQVAMLLRLTTLHGRELTADLAAKLLGPLAARVAGRFAFEQAAKFIPGIGSIMGAAVAGGMTYALGMAYHTLLCNELWNFDAGTLQEEVLRWWKSHGKKLHNFPSNGISFS